MQAQLLEGHATGLGDHTLRQYGIAIPVVGPADLPLAQPIGDLRIAESGPAGDEPAGKPETAQQGAVKILTVEKIDTAV